MGLKLVRNCYGSASRHPFLLFMICVLICIYRWFPVLFSILVYVSPVIASTLILLGTLLFYGHANAPEIQKEAKSHHRDFNLVFGGIGNAEIDVENMNVNDDHKFNQEAKSELGNRKLVLVNRFGQFQQFETGNTKLKSRDGSRRNSIDPLQSVLGHTDDHDVDRGWDTGSDVGSSSPSASVADIFRMINEHHPMNSDKMFNETYDDEDYDHEEMLVKDFDEDESYLKWTEDDQRNLMNLGSLELERNQRLESLIARQKAIKNMRLAAERNMANISNDMHSIGVHVSTANNNPFDLLNHSHENILGSDPSNMLPKRYSFDFPYDQRVPERIVADAESVGSNHTFNINDHIISRNRFSEDDDTVKLHQVVDEDDRSNEFIASSENTGYEDKTSRKSSSSSVIDVTDDINNGDGDDDNVEEDRNSIDDSSSSRSDSEDEDSEESDVEEVGLAQRLKTWFTSW